MTRSRRQTSDQNSGLATAQGGVRNPISRGFAQHHAKVRRAIATHLVAKPLTPAVGRQRELGSGDTTRSGSVPVDRASFSAGESRRTADMPPGPDRVSPSGD